MISRPPRARIRLAVSSYTFAATVPRIGGLWWRECGTHQNEKI